MIGELNKTKLTISIIALTIIGFLINNRIEFIPSWISFDDSINYISLIFLTVSIILGIILISLLLKSITKNPSRLSRRIKIIIFSLGVAGYLCLSVSFTLIYSRHSVLERMFSGRELIGKFSDQKFKKTFYIYEHPCFLGATIKEPCSDYGSLLYLKRKGLPTMYAIAKFPFPAGEIYKKDNSIEIHPNFKYWDFNNNYLVINLSTDETKIISK